MSQSTKSIKINEKINEEIVSITRLLNNNYDDNDTLHFYNGKLSALTWVLKLEV